MVTLIKTYLSPEGIGDAAIGARASSRGLVLAALEIITCRLDYLTLNHSLFIYFIKVNNKKIMYF